MKERTRKEKKRVKNVFVHFEEKINYGIYENK